MLKRHPRSLDSVFFDWQIGDQVMKLALCILILVSCSVGFGAAQEPSRIEPSKPIERELSVGESHTYQINFTAGAFVRFRLDQRAIDASLTLTEEDNNS